MYELVLFAHLLGVAALVACLAFSLGGFVRAQRAATVEQVRSSLSFVSVTERAIPPTMLVLLASGLYLVEDGSWGWGSGWVDVAIGLFLLMGVLGIAVEDKRIALVRDEAERIQSGPVTTELETMRRDPVLTHVVAFGAAQLIVFLYLMTTKPGWAEALAAVAVMGLLSVPVARAQLRPGPRREEAAAVPATDSVAP